MVLLMPTVTRRRRLGLTAAALAMAASTTVALAPSASADGYRLTDPVVYRYHACPKSYIKGVINIYRYYLKADTAVGCSYYMYEYGYYTGVTHSFSKIA